MNINLQKRMENIFYEIMKCTQLYLSVYGVRIDSVFKKSELLKEIYASNELYFDSLPKTSINSGVRMLEMGIVNSKNSLTQREIHNLRNKKKYGKKYISDEAMKSLLEIGNLNLLNKDEYIGEIPEKLIEAIHNTTSTKYLYYSEDGYLNNWWFYPYDNSDFFADLRTASYGNVFNANELKKGEEVRMNSVPNIKDGYYKMYREDFILTYTKTVGFDEFKNDSTVNKCESALYITRTNNGYRIIESW